MTVDYWPYPWTLAYGIPLVEPAITDAMLARLEASGDVRGEIRRLLQESQLANSPGYQKLLRLRDYCKDKIKALAFESSLEYDAGGKQLAAWRQNATRVDEAIAWTLNQQQITTDQINAHLVRYLLVSIDIGETMARATSIEGHLVKDGILVPKAGRGR